MWSPAWANVKNTYVIAAIPEATANAPTPPSSALILSSNTEVVGLVIRV